MKYFMSIYNNIIIFMMLFLPCRPLPEEMAREDTLIIYCTSMIEWGMSALIRCSDNATKSILTTVIKHSTEICLKVCL